MRVGALRGLPQGGVVKFSIYLETAETAMVIFADDGPQFMPATVCPPMGSPRAGKNEVWIKSWGANHGVLEALIEAGIVTKLPVVCECGNAFATLCALTAEAIAARNEAFDALPGLRDLQTKAYERRARLGLSPPHSQAQEQTR
jgi:hypothetical protein